MALQRFKNNASTTLATSIVIADTALTVTAGGGAEFPSTAGGDFFYFTIEDNAGNIEVCKCTTRTTDTFSVIVRAQEGTVAQNWTNGARIELRVTAAWLEKVILEDGSNAMTAALDMGTQHITNANNITATGTVQGANVTATSTVQGVSVTATGTATGNILKFGTTPGLLQNNNGETALSAVANGETNLCYNGLVTLQTDSQGIVAYSPTNDVVARFRRADNAETLRLWSTTAGGYAQLVNFLNGQLVYISGTTTGGASVNMMSLNPDGAVSLTHNGNVKLSTGAGGVAVTGTLDATTLTQGGTGVSLSTHTHSGLVTRFESSEQSMSTNGSVSHGLGATPHWFQVVMRCVSNDSGTQYVTGDEVDIMGGYGTATVSDTPWANSTSIGWSLNQANPAIILKNSTSAQNITAANWRIVCRGFRVS